MENEALKKSALGSGANPMMSSVSKVIQPTATVSSVPVSGPSKSLQLLFEISVMKFCSLLATGIARSISPGQVLRQDSSSAMTSGSSVATIIRAHSVQHATAPQPPMKKGQFVASSARVPPPIPPNKPIINKGGANTSTNASRISFLQSQTVQSPAQAIAAQNAKDGDE